MKPTHRAQAEVGLKRQIRASFSKRSSSSGERCSFVHVRWYSLLLDGRIGPLSRAARLYDHPDAAEYGCGVRTASQADLAAHADGVDPNEFTFTRAASIPSWSFVIDYEGTKRGKPGRFRRSYRDVTALTVKSSYANFSPDTSTVHAVKHNGLWERLSVLSMTD
jgi:hypothetical protein